LLNRCERQLGVDAKGWGGWSRKIVKRRISHML
jgi:hypothetical protein